jgi:hypothetical protein
MITVKVTNCVHQGRRNQNTTFFFSERNHGFGKDDDVTEDWMLLNLNTLANDILPQNNTKIKLIKQ